MEIVIWFFALFRALYSSHSLINLPLKMTEENLGERVFAHSSIQIFFTVFWFMELYTAPILVSVVGPRSP